MPIDKLHPVTATAAGSNSMQAGSCMLRCPQCLHLINLLASLQLASQDGGGASAAPPTTSEPPPTRPLDKIASKAALKQQQQPTRPIKSPTSIVPIMPRTSSTVSFFSAPPAYGSMGAQHIRLATGHTVKVVATGRRAAPPTPSNRVPPAPAPPTTVASTSNPLADEDHYGGGSSMNCFTSLGGGGDEDPRNLNSIRQISSAPNTPMIVLDAHGRSNADGPVESAFSEQQPSTSPLGPRMDTESPSFQDVNDLVTEALLEMHKGSNGGGSAAFSGTFNPLQWPPAGGGGGGGGGRTGRKDSGGVLSDLVSSSSQRVVPVVSGMMRPAGTTSDATSRFGGEDSTHVSSAGMLRLEDSSRSEGSSNRPRRTQQEDGGVQHTFAASGMMRRDMSSLCLQPSMMSADQQHVNVVRKSTMLARKSTASVLQRTPIRGPRQTTVVLPDPATDAPGTAEVTTAQTVRTRSGRRQAGIVADVADGDQASWLTKNEMSDSSSFGFISTLKSVKAYLTNLSALDDASAVLQLLDVIFVLASVYLCCLALFLLHGPSRPWLINDATGAFVILAQLFTLGWTALQCFVRNRATPTSFVVNDTVGDTAKKYVASADFWLDVIVAVPVEWMVVPLLTARDMSWWALQPTAPTTSPPGSLYRSQNSWETAAAVFSFLMLRHLLRYWRIASLIRSSNPIVSERSIFRFLFAVSVAFGIVCVCAVAFQVWEGPTLAPPETSVVLGVNVSVGANLDKGASATTPGLFATFDALYWSMTTALTVGYGDITPKSAGGRAIAIITMIAGTALLSIMTAIATSFFANKDPVQQELEERMRKMTSMLEYFEVPWDLQRDVIASFPAVMEAHSKAAFLDMINVLPEICRNRVEGYSRLRLLRQIPHFEGIEREHAFMLAKCLTQHFVAAQDTVVVQGEMGNEMYFVVQGMLDVLVQLTDDGDEHVVVATIREGSFFGEHGLLEDTPRASTVMAITLSELLVLTRADFQEIVAAVPEIMDVFRRNVFKVSEDAARAIAADASEVHWLKPHLFDPNQAPPAADASVPIPDPGLAASQ